VEAFEAAEAERKEAVKAEESGLTIRSHVPALPRGARKNNYDLDEEEDCK